jgi:hypothetical protein
VQILALERQEELALMMIDDFRFWRRAEADPRAVLAWASPTTSRG